MSTRWTEEQLQSYLTTYNRNKSFNGVQETPDQGPESKLQRKIEIWCSDHGFPFFHDRSRKKNKAGWPDLTIAMPNGVVLFIELKSAKGVFRKEQKLIQQQLLYLGHNYQVVRSFKKFLEIALGAKKRISD